MASFFRRDFTSGFSLDRIEVQETARRQFFISAVMVAVILCFATLAALRENMRPAYKPAEVTGRDDSSPSPIKTHVRYVDRFGYPHRVAVASTKN
jgi:hypothetical protein